MKTREEQTESATAVAMAVFDLFEVTADEVVFDVSVAIDLIEEYAGRRVREAWRRPGSGKVVQLPVVSGSGSRGSLPAANECMVCGARLA